ncbi:MAG TPA: hypothetical protein VMU45_07735 [Candidatus Eisenbacteria bacterium]|nr:hypothetical protein [Candidatus Eisenbacteria bacterium]
MTKIPVRFALLALALTVTISAFAKPKSENVTLYQDATVNGTNLPAGDYVVKYDVSGSNAQVKFMKSGKEVASTNGEVKTLAKKPAANQVVTTDEAGSHVISEIDFGGKDTALTFGAAGTAAGK